MTDINIDIKEDLDFEVKKFEFNRYKLKDGTVLRLVCVPVKIMKTEKYDNRGIPQYVVQSQSILSAVVDDALRGPSEIFNPLEQISPEDLEPIDFDPIIEPWNEYELSDGVILKFRTSVTQVDRYKGRNQFGEPVYFVKENKSLNTRASKHLRKRR